MAYSPDQKDVEGIHEIEDKAPKKCPSCGKPLRKIVTSREFGSFSNKCPWCKCKFHVEEDGTYVIDEPGKKTK